MNASKKPSLSCPAYVCRRIRKILADAGLPMSKSTGCYSAFGGGTKRRTPGYSISKVGCSRHVALDFNVGHGGEFGHHQRLRPGERGERLAVAIATLRDRGYPVDDRGWIECEGYDG